MLFSELAVDIWTAPTPALPFAVALLRESASARVQVGHRCATPAQARSEPKGPGRFEAAERPIEHEWGIALCVGPFPQLPQG